MLCRIILACLLSSSAYSLGLYETETFDEALSIRQLRDGKVASSFSFNIWLADAIPRNPETLGSEDDIPQHYALFPLPLGQILREYAVTELHLTLNAGKWDYETWGYPEEEGVGTGAELWTWMGEGGTMSVDTRWQGLRNALAGIFCASLGSMDDQRTTSPADMFSPEGSLPSWRNDTSHTLRHATLPSEHVCTENLTPFLKLLPCKSLSGIAALLNPHKLFETNFHGMGIHVKWDEERGINVRLTFQMVSDPLRVSSINRDWSFGSLFNRKIQRSCPVASTSHVSVTLPPGSLYKMSPGPSSAAESQATYITENLTEALDVKVQHAHNFQYPLTPADPPLTDLSVQRFLRGASQAHGQITVVLRNNLDEPASVLYLETMPWLVQFYLHSMHIYVNDTIRDDLISDISYILPIPHSRPATFQSTVTIPAQSTAYFHIDVAKAFLRYTEHMPDAQRGWDLPPAVFLPLSDDGRKRKRVYTPILLVDLATPDFSMPYNVIIFTCSIVAFVFGTVFNLLTRKFVVVRLDGEEKHEEEKPKGEVS